ncbi:MAG: hypothetical protein KAU94_08450, partial [Verrucomicrobia bacterium]|nr:hypothetical protein [Verrucomicrobiota bacterium]
SDASPSAVEEILSACYALYILSGDSDKMIESCTTAVTTHISSANTVALALFLRGTAYCEQGKQWDQAISDFSQGIDLADRIDDKSIISGLLSLRALLYEKQNKVDLAIADYNRVLNHTNTSVDDKIMAHLALASLAIKTGDWATGVKFIQEGFHLKQRDDARPSKRISLYIDGIVESIFRQATSPTDCSGPLAELASLFNRFGYAPDLGDALIKHLGSINKKNRPSNSLLERWLEIWEPSLANHAEYEVVLRLLKTGVRFLMADGDKSVLLDLVKPEREILYQAFGLSAGA